MIRTTGATTEPTGGNPIGIRIRPFRPDDAQAMYELRLVIIPFTLTTPESARWRFETASARVHLLSRVAERDGAIAGSLRAGLQWESAEPGQGFIEVMVADGHRGHGVGAALLTTAQDHLRALGARTMRAFVMDEDGRRFAEKAGYTELSAVRFQELDLAVLPAVPDPPALPGGMELLPYDAFAADPAPVHAVETRAMRDEPGYLSVEETPFETWIEQQWGHPLLDRELSTVVAVDGTPAAIVGITTDGRTRVSSSYTGTLPEYRGRGLIKYAKSVVLHRARERGFTRAFTDNHERNAPMPAINSWLGYRPCGRESTYSRAA